MSGAWTYRPNKWLASENWLVQVGGALMVGYRWIFTMVFLVLIALSAGVLSLVGMSLGDDWDMATRMITITYFFVLSCLTVSKLTPTFCLRKQEHRITYSQLFLLFAFGVLLVGAILIFGITGKTENTLPFSIVGAVLGWAFQDTIKSVAAFFYLRINDMLHIGDWIEVKSHGVDGIVKSITLTTVCVENWDTTTSSFPTYILHHEHFQNYQDMLEGKTHGRQMLKTFVVDTGWVHPLSENNVKEIKAHLGEDFAPFVADKVRVGELNAEVFRLFVFHYLKNHRKISHKPRLLVRWLEQTHEGMPLQMYAYITDTSLEPFEWQQSQIMEFVIKALPWFGMKLYQSPSGYDESNGNIYMTDKEAEYGR